MVKTHKNLEFFDRFSSNSLSICENRKNNLAVTKLNSGRLQSRSVPKRLDLYRGTNKLRTRIGGLSKSPVLFERGHRNVSSLTIELIALIYQASDTSAIQDNAKKARGPICCPDSILVSMSPIPGTSAEEHSIAQRRMS